MTRVTTKYQTLLARAVVWLDDSQVQLLTHGDRIDCLDSLTMAIEQIELAKTLIRSTLPKPPPPKGKKK